MVISADLFDESLTLSERIMHLAREHATPLTLSEIATLLDEPTTTVHRHLKRLVEENYLKHDRRGRSVFYRPIPRLAVDWLWQRALPDRPPTWVHRGWTFLGDVDWRFPLLTAVPDDNGREAVLRFLQVAWSRGLFQPWIKEGKDAPPASWGGVTIMVFGSCARGDARSDSDVDVAIFETTHDDGPPVPSQKEEFTDLVDAVNLASLRYIDLHVFCNDDGVEAGLSDRLRDAIYEEGITVYTTGRFAEATRHHAEAVHQIMGDEALE